MSLAFCWEQPPPNGHLARHREGVVGLHVLIYSYSYETLLWCIITAEIIKEMLHHLTARSNLGAKDVLILFVDYQIDLFYQEHIAEKLVHRMLYCRKKWESRKIKRSIIEVGFFLCGRKQYADVKTVWLQNEKKNYLFSANVWDLSLTYWVTVVISPIGIVFSLE